MRCFIFWSGPPREIKTPQPKQTALNLIERQLRVGRSPASAPPRTGTCIETPDKPPPASSPSGA